MKPKTMLAAGAVAASIAAGAGVGALLFTPGSSTAQNATASAPATAPQYGGGDRHGFGRGFGLDAGAGVELGVAAKAIGITEDQLKTELQSGKSIADVAKEHGVDVQKVIDALVADVKARLQQLEADLPSRIAAIVNGQMPFGRPGGKLGGPLGGQLREWIGTGIDTAANAIGITSQQLMSELAGGKSIADVAKAHGVDPQKVIDALKAAATQKIDAAAGNGTITQDQATKLKDNLDRLITNLVNGERPGRFGNRGTKPSATPGSYTS